MMDLLSENSMSPRISFSHDLSQSDIFDFPVEQRLLRSSSSSSVDFDFCINRSSFNQESSTAEELFSNGKILPTDQLLSKEDPRPPALPPAPAPLDHLGAVDSTKNGAVVDSKNNNSKNDINDSNETKQKYSKSSFWQFKRSNSLNSGNGYARSLCPLPPLLRSNSTGSSSSSKRSSSSKDKQQQQQHSQKTPLVATIKHSQFSSSNNRYQKPPIKKNGFGGNGYGPSSHGNGTAVRNRINPVLNVPSANLFGLGSIFSSSKRR